METYPMEQITQEVGKEPEKNPTLLTERSIGWELR